MPASSPATWWSAANWSAGTPCSARGVAVPNTLAAIMLHLAKQTSEPPHIYFAWSERGPAENVMMFLMGGGGDIAPLTHEILRVAEPDAAKRPHVHVGG